MNITELRTKAKANVKSIKAEYKLAKKSVKDIVAKAKRIFSYEEAGENHYEWRDRNLSSDDNYNGNFDEMADSLNEWAKSLYKNFREKVGKFIKIEVTTESVYGVVNIDVYPELEPLKNVMFTEFKEALLANPKLFGDVFYTYEGYLARKIDKHTEMYSKRIVSFARIYGLELVLSERYNLTAFNVK
jgi:hypothetical protein